MEEAGGSSLKYLEGLITRITEREDEDRERSVHSEGEEGSFKGEDQSGYEQKKRVKKRRSLEDSTKKSEILRLEEDVQNEFFNAAQVHYFVTTGLLISSRKEMSRPSPSSWRINRN